MSARNRHLFSGSVFVMAQRGDGCILMLRRSGTGWMDGWWSLPAGGLDKGETLSAAAARELSEEVGLVVPPTALEHVHAIHSLTEQRDWVGHFFVVRAFEGEPRLCEPDKHDALGWFALSDLPSPVIPYVRQSLEKISANEHYSEYGWIASA